MLQVSNMLKRVQREDKVEEFFISEKFIQSQEWGSLSLDQPCYKKINKYRYIKDYVKYNGTECCQDLTNRLKFSEITHAADQNELMSIIKDGGLKPGKKAIPDCNIDSFVWFGIHIGESERDSLKNYYTSVCLMKKQDISGRTEDLSDVDVRSIVNSPCFEPISRYGEFKFTFEIRDVIYKYMRQFCQRNQQTSDWAKPDFRMLGTFIYKMETMHTVLVSPPDTPGTKKYPLLGPNQTPVICEDPEKEGTFIWCPDSTGDKDKASKNDRECAPFRRWEHVTFAFYVPNGSILKLSNVWDHLSLCIYVNPMKGFEKSLINDTIKKFLDKVRKDLRIKRFLVKLLICSIRGYLDSEKIFEKMNILHMYDTVDLEPIVERVEELLDGEEFDWSPLFEWMKAVQKTKNNDVLKSILKYLNNRKEICVTKLQNNGLQ